MATHGTIPIFCFLKNRFFLVLLAFPSLFFFFYYFMYCHFFFFNVLEIIYMACITSRLDLHWFLFLGLSVEERDIQKKYWMDNISDLSVNAMMLDSKASELDKEERPEVHFSLLLQKMLLSFLFYYVHGNVECVIVILFDLNPNPVYLMFSTLVFGSINCGVMNCKMIVQDPCFGCSLLLLCLI